MKSKARASHEATHQTVPLEIETACEKMSMQLGFSNQRLTPHGGMALMSSFWARLDWRRKVAAALPQQPRSPNADQPVDIALGFMGGVLVCADKFSRVGQLAGDPALSEILGTVFQNNWRRKALPGGHRAVGAGWRADCPVSNGVRANARQRHQSTCIQRLHHYLNRFSSLIIRGSPDMASMISHRARSLMLRAASRGGGTGNEEYCGLHQVPRRLYRSSRDLYGSSLDLFRSPFGLQRSSHSFLGSSLHLLGSSRNS
jgi:hypothetical protein